MARNFKEIKSLMTQSFINNATVISVYELVEGQTFEQQFSELSIESILFDVVAGAVFLLELIFDQHKQEVDKAIYEQKSGTPRWYRNTALSFQYGFDLLVDSDKFNNTGYTDAEVEASKIIKYCSVKETQESSKLIMKIAAEASGELAPITDDQKTAFLFYMNEIKYAGVKINCINNPADVLYLNMQVFRDPMIIDAQGNNILTGEKTVELAIKAYIKTLPFDGEFLVNDFIQFLRAVPGVLNVNIILAQSSHWDVVANAQTTPQPINVKVIPEAGYFIITTFNEISYLVSTT